MPEFSKPPAGSSFAGQDKVKTFDKPPTDVEDKLREAADILGGKLDGEVKEKEEAKELEELESIPEEDKKKYIRSMLAKERFTKDYPLFGGQIVVTFNTRTVSENKALESVEDELKAVHKLSNTIATIGTADVDGTCDAEDILKMDDVLYAAIMRAFGEFEELCDTLFRRANRPDFWTGTGGVT